MSQQIKRYTIDICDDCLNLRGEMCHNPRCSFCRKTMKEVEQILEDTMITAKVAGYRQPGKVLIN